MLFSFKRKPHSRPRIFIHSHLSQFHTRAKLRPFASRSDSTAAEARQPASFYSSSPKCTIDRHPHFHVLRGNSISSTHTRRSPSNCTAGQVQRHERLQQIKTKGNASENRSPPPSTASSHETRLFVFNLRTLPRFTAHNTPSGRLQLEIYQDSQRSLYPIAGSIIRSKPKHLHMLPYYKPH